MTLSNFKSEVLEEFFHILDYWHKYAIDEKNGGFIGTIDDQNTQKESIKSVVVNGRILWTFSTAIQFINSTPALFPYKNRIKDYEKLSKRAFDYLVKYFWDTKNGGVHWNVSATGVAIAGPKVIYGHSFFVYGMSEYYRATGHKPALEWAQKCFNEIAKHAYDPIKGGYIEGFAMDWGPTDDYVLSKGDLRKSMNTHLHLLECFANLYRVDKSENVRFHLKHCLEMMVEHIIGHDHTRMTLFFTDDWEAKTKAISYGHDIEASWLVLESAEILGDEELIEYCKKKCLEIARDAAEGLQSDNGMIYEFDQEDGHSNNSRDWWVMAEAMVGFYNAYQLSGKAHYLQKAENSWQFIKDYLIDHQGGEWWGGVTADHKITGKTKANPWKGPYHNARACMEIYKRIG